MTEPKVTQLNEKAMLVKLTTRRANLTRRDQTAEAIIQAQMDDASLIVNSKLFRDKDNPINELLSAMSEVYTYHKKHTIPYVDKGPRILPNTVYMDYTSDMRSLIAKVDGLLAKFLPDWDKYVQLDIAYRSAAAVAQGATPRAKVEDYPTANEFAARMGFDLRFLPLPDRKHFLFDISDEDVQNFVQAMQDVEKLARTDVVSRMLEPLKHLVDKLNRPIGTEKSVFRDSAVENVIEGLEVARKLMLDDNPEMVQVIKELEQTMGTYNEHKQWLRESPIVREQAAKKLDDIAKQMGAFMGV